MYFQSPTAQISWNDEVQAVQVMYKVLNSSIDAKKQVHKSLLERDTFRAVMNKSLELAEKKQSKSWIANLHNAAVLTQEDTVWSVQEWLPRAVAAGIEKIAIIPPDGVLGTMTANALINGMTAIPVVQCSSVEEAAAWLASVKN